MDRVYTLNNYTRQPLHITYFTLHYVPNITTINDDTYYYNYY